MSRHSLIISSLLFFVTFFLIASPIQAVDSTPSAELKEKLRLLQEEIASKAAKLKQEISQKLQNKVYVGLVKSKSSGSLNLATTATGTKIVNLNEFTEYLGTAKEKTKISLKTLTEEDYVATLGDVDENEVMTAKRVVKLEPVKAQKQLMFGTVVNTTSKVLTLKSKDKQNLELTLDKFTTILEGTKEISATSLKEGQMVFVVSENANRARFVYLFTTKSLKNKTASSSANF